MLKKLIIIILGFLFLSCDNGQSINDSYDKNNLEYINEYYRISNDKKKPIKERYNAINKGYSIIKKYEKDTIFLKILYKKSVMHSSLKQFDSLLYFNDLLLKHSRNSKNQYYLGKSYYLKAYYFNTIVNIPDSSFYYYNKSKNNFLNIRDSSEVGKKLLNMAYIQQNCSDYFGSKETITEALQYLNPDKDIRFMASSYNVLATNHRKLLNNHDAIKYYIKAIETTKSNKDRLIYKNNLSTVYIDDKQYKNAINQLLNVMKDSLLNAIPTQKARVIDNLAYTKWLSNKTNIEEGLLRALQIRLSNNDKRGQIASYTHLAEYFSENDTQVAKKWIKKAIEISKSIKNPKGELDALKFSTIIEPNNLQVKNRYIELGDSIYKQELKVKTQFAKIKYDDKVKQEEILLLQSQKARQESETARERTQKIMYLFGSIILILSGGFVFYFLQQRYKREKIREVYNAETRISKKLHDELANDVYNVMVQIQNDQNSPDVLDKLEEIYNTTRDISREHNSFTTGENYAVELTNMLSGYSSNETKIIIKNIDDIIWESINPEKKIIVHRTLQELMINMKKHSEAGLVAITFKKTLKNTGITYADNGIGVSKNEIIHSNGLRNAENRIKTIGGSFIFDSEKGKGFKARISFPN